MKTRLSEELDNLCRARDYLHLIFNKNNGNITYNFSRHLQYI